MLHTHTRAGSYLPQVLSNLDRHRCSRGSLLLRARIYFRRSVALTWPKNGRSFSASRKDSSLSLAVFIRVTFKPSFGLDTFGFPVPLILFTPDPIEFSLLVGIKLIFFCFLGRDIDCATQTISLLYRLPPGEERENLRVLGSQPISSLNARENHLTRV